MKSRIFPGAFFILVIVLGLSLRAQAAKEIVEIIPDEIMVMASLKNIKSDPGLRFIMERYREKASRKESKRNIEVVEELYAKLNFSQVVCAMLMKEREDTPRYLIAVSLPGVTAEEKNVHIFTKALNTLLKKEDESLRSEDYLKHEIIYNYQREWKRPDEISAYTCLEDKVILGTDRDILKKVIMVAEGRKKSIAQSKKFADMKAKFIEAGDGFIYIDNRDVNFAQNLRYWEEEGHISLLLSAEHIHSLGISFNLVDEDRATGKIIFTALGKEALPDIRDDAQFLGEAIKRKFTAEKIDYTSKVVVKDKDVILDFTVAGLRPVWIKAFQEKKKERREAPLESVSEEIEKTYWSKILPAILLVVVILLIFGVPKRKKK